MRLRTPKTRWWQAASSFAAMTPKPKCCEASAATRNAATPESGSLWGLSQGLPVGPAGT